MAKRKLHAFYIQSENRQKRRSSRRKARLPSYFVWANDTLRLTKSTVTWITKSPAATPRWQSRLPRNSDETYAEARPPMDSKCAESRASRASAQRQSPVSTTIGISYGCGPDVFLGSDSRPNFSTGRNSHGINSNGRPYPKEFRFPGESGRPTLFGRSPIQGSGPA